MQVIGFATKFYTLWEVNSETIRTQFELIHRTNYVYVKNISFSMDKVKELYPDTKIDLSLRGSSSFHIDSSEKINQDCFQYGKYCGRKISECCDHSYMMWYFNNGCSHETKETIKSVLLPTGEYVIYSDYDGDEKLRTIEEQQQIDAEVAAIDDIENSFKELGYIDLFIGSNPNCDGWLTTENASLHFPKVSENYYSGITYYLPVDANGKSKRIKNKNVRFYGSVERDSDYFINIKVSKFEILK